MWPQINTKGEESVGRERTAAMLSRIEHVRGETIKNIYIVLGHTSYIRGDHQDSLKVGDSEGNLKRIK